MANISIGTICLVTTSSVQSLVLWKQLAKRLPYLLCPCSIHSTTKLRVVQDFGTSVLLQLVDSPKQFTVLKKLDLKPMHT